MVLSRRQISFERTFLRRYLSRHSYGEFAVRRKCLACGIAKTIAEETLARKRRRRILQKSVRQRACKNGEKCANFGCLRFFFFFIIIPSLVLRPNHTILRVYGCLLSLPQSISKVFVSFGRGYYIFEGERMMRNWKRMCALLARSNER